MNLDFGERVGENTFQEEELLIESQGKREPISGGKGITTLAGLVQHYISVCPDVLVDVKAAPWCGDIRSYVNHVQTLVFRIRAQFPNVEVWDYLGETLQHSIRYYDSLKGPFDKLLARTLTERLRKEQARAKQSKHRIRKAEVEYAYARSKRGCDNERYYRWAALILEQVSDQVNQHTRDFLRMRRAGVSFKDIALMLGVSEQSLKNEFGGQKLRTKVRRAVRKMVLSLPEWHRRLLVQHLLVEAELQPEEVERLLGVFCNTVGVPVLSEARLLQVLGWEEKNFGLFGN